MTWSLRIGLCGALLASAADAQLPDVRADGLMPPGPAEHVVYGVVVIRVSSPPALPGVTHGFINMDLWVNERLSYLAHLPYFGDQFIPAAGAICRIRFNYGALQAGVVPLNDGRLSIFVNELDCNTGRWSLEG